MKGFTPILAEVADKEPSLTAIWCIAVFLCVVAFLLRRWRRIACWVPLPLAVAWACAMLSELHDPYVGPAILAELGRRYVAQAYVAALIPLVIAATGFWRRRHDPI